ncbi:MAG: deoxyribodipyrimidine photo-lyase [Saprospiraceae bacterium]|nr:deoxyribodipyrimidine photo-lyase [Saprospiraceae bacterium]
MVAIFWFRRDLRLEDNAGLFHALKGEHPVLPLFIFDREILDNLPDASDARVQFIHQTLEQLQQQLEALGSSLLVLHGTPETAWKQVLETYPVAAVYTNRDYEPYAKTRDASIAHLLGDIPFRTFKDHVIFETGEVLKDDGKPYTVFTPYSKKWRAKLNAPLADQSEPSDIPFYLSAYPTERYFQHFYQCPSLPMPSLAALGFEPSALSIPPNTVPRGIIRNYAALRDFPAKNGTSRLGIHFRFGTISIREKARNALELSDIFLNELIWRDFYSQILGHFPQVADRAFKPQYDRIPWLNDPDGFEKWCQGKTGYPLVDAGMRELNATGFMHNRVRMITASFLTKHLLIDWRLGAQYFSQKLLDFDLASNSGGWQWAAGCGTDAAPYFRIFNPTEQLKKFDPDYAYIRQWVPEFGTPKYPKPMVEHSFARQRCLETYKKALEVI